MKRPKATVLVPTHDHGPTLLYSVRSALAQTAPDIEVFIVGDGVPDVTREVVARLMDEDKRVRFFDNPKGPRHGEVHRHAALQHARGEIVAYLADDDLWLPSHIETMWRLLQEADFAHALPLAVRTDDTVITWNVDLAIPYYRDLIINSENRIPLACGAHTMEMYRRLPDGWNTTPDDVYTDLHMWRKFLRHPECRAVSSGRPTVIHFPSAWRTDRPLQQRLAELERWARSVADAAWQGRFVLDVLEGVARDRARMEDHTAVLDTQIQGIQETLLRLERELHDAVADRDRLAAEGDRLAAERDRLQAQADGLRTELQGAAAGREALREQLEAIYRLRWWRLRERLLRLPLAPTLMRWAGRVLARPSAR